MSTPTIAELRAQLAKVKPGDTVELGVSRGIAASEGKDLVVTVKTMADPSNKKRAIVGFAPEQAAEIRLPLKVSIDAGNVGGPSAGLAFALEVMEELGHNVDRGYKRRRDRADRARRHGHADRRREAEDVRRPRRRKRTSSSCRLGKTRAEARRYANGLRDHRCEEFSPGVARAGNAAPERVENDNIPAAFETAGNSSVFVGGNACRRAETALRSPLVADLHPQTVRTDEQTN